MRLEEVRLEIRPRTILECLDLTFIVCGRYWIGLFAAAAVGAVPMIFLNRRLLDSEYPGTWTTILLLSMEVPWAMAPITLYLGQITFSSRFSSRRALRAFTGTLGSLILYQFIVRGACLAMVILSPIIVIAAYYLNEIILLERLPVAKVWSRRGAMNARNSGKIISLRVIDLLVLLGGYWVLVRMFRAVSSLWRDQFSFSFVEFAHGDFDLFVQADWESQVAFWAVVAFLTVFRFVTYLDCRIRREGWDVELLLRTQAALYRQELA